jgi:peptide/nickel transport system permease protein
MRLEYLLKRLLMFVLVIWAAATLNFFLPRFSGTDPIRTQLMTQAASGGAIQSGIGQMVEVYQQKFGLDQPLWKQYFTYLGQIARLDLGYSMAYYPTTVWEILARALPWTLGLLVTATLLAFTIGTLLGALLGWGKAPRWVHFMFPPLLVFAAIPFFLLGLLLLYLFAFQFPILPLFGGYTAGTTPNWSWEFAKDVVIHSLLPAFSVLLASMGFWALGMRGMMITAEGEDYMIFAEASGLKGRTRFFHYGVRNALLPQTTALGLSLAQVLSGALLVEAVFSYPGIGSILVGAIRGFDFFLIQGIIIIIVLGVSLATLILDLIYPLIDPRITYQ